MHYSERVLEPIVHCTGINLICPRKLPDTAQPLESGSSNDLSLPVVEAYKAVNGAPDLICSVWVQGTDPAGVDNVSHRANKRRIHARSCVLPPVR
jgi:hypothetical protein